MKSFPAKVLSIQITFRKVQNGPEKVASNFIAAWSERPAPCTHTAKTNPILWTKIVRLRPRDFLAAIKTDVFFPTCRFDRLTIDTAGTRLGVASCL